MAQSFVCILIDKLEAKSQYYPEILKVSQKGNFASGPSLKSYGPKTHLTLFLSSVPMSPPLTQKITKPSCPAWGGFN